MLFDIFQYGFMQRALLSAVAISIMCSIVGLFLVLKRHSLFGDALAHVAFGGIALGLFTGVYPILTAYVVAILSAVGVNKLRASTKIPPRCFIRRADQELKPPNPLVSPFHLNPSYIYRSCMDSNVAVHECLFLKTRSGEDPPWPGKRNPGSSRRRSRLSRDSLGRNRRRCPRNRCCRFLRWGLRLTSCRAS